MRLTEKDRAYIRKYYKTQTNIHMAKKIGCDVHTIGANMAQMGLVREPKINREEFEKYYPYDSNRQLSVRFRCDVATIKRKAELWGLEKRDRLLDDTLLIEGVTYKRCTETLHCSKDGRFLHKGRPIKVVYPYTMNGKRGTAKVVVSREYYQASRLVAKAWIEGYTEGSYIVYKDENIHNIKAENLIVSNLKRYTAYKMRNTEFKAEDLEGRKRKLHLVIEEASLTLNYLKTKDFEPINKHVTSYLLKCLNDYCIKTLQMGERTTKRVVGECLATMYEVIYNGYALYNYERYCKKLLFNYKKKGTFGVTANIPKPIEIEIEKIDINPLLEKFNSKYKYNKKRKSL